MFHKKKFAKKFIRAILWDAKGCEIPVQNISDRKFDLQTKVFGFPQYVGPVHWHCFDINF